jgi:lipopolysaccharide transport system permease protein
LLGPSAVIEFTEQSKEPDLSDVETAVLMPPTHPPTAGRVDAYLKITPPTGWSALNLREVWRFRDLLLALAGRDVKLRYKQTALGILWVILQPLMAAGVFSFVFGRVAQLPSNGIPYFLFSYAGLLGWNLFSSTLTKTSACLVGNSQLISKIFFPRLVLPLSAVPSVLIDFAVAMGMMIVLMFIYHCSPNAGILLFPVWMLMLLMMALGIGLITAALTVSYRDVQYILPVFVQILLYGSPVAYGLSYALTRIPGNLQFLYLMNPLCGPLEAFRASLLGTPWPPQLAWSLLYSGVASVWIFFVGAYSFKKMERKFADVI